MVGGVGVDPAQVLIGSLSERFLADALDLLDRAEEVDDVLGPTMFSGRDNAERYPRITMRSKQ
jgi:hypothetical protein